MGIFLINQKKMLMKTLARRGALQKAMIMPAQRNFGILQDYRDRQNKKLINNILCTDRPMYWVTSTRPSNSGDPLDTKTKPDNWFDENRLWNEENRDYEIKRAQIYMLQGFVISFYALGIKTILAVIYNQMITRSRYI